MKTPVRFFWLLAVWAAVSIVAGAQTERAVAIRGATVLTIAGETIENGTIVIQGGRITAVGSSVTVPAGAEIVEAAGKFVMPGLIDSMTSIGIDNPNLNEVSKPIVPEVRALESFNPFGDFGRGEPGPIRLTEPLSGGVTTMYVAPADVSLIGGQGVVVKTAGADLDGIVVLEPAAIDMALGEQPKKAFRSKNQDPSTRMAEIAMLRQTLIRAQEYARAREQDADAPRDLAMEALAGLLAGELPARIQANSNTDIRSALRLAEEFGFQLILDGAAASLDFAPTLVERGVPVVLGQVSHQFVSNEEIPDRTEYPPVDERRPAQLTAAGVEVAIASFSRAFGTLAPGGTGKWLLVDAAIAGGYGMADDDILRSVTINAARILGIEDRVGSIEVGKDADLIVLDGPPLSIRTWVERVYVNGELVHVREARE